MKEEEEERPEGRTTYRKKNFLGVQFEGFIVYDWRHMTEEERAVVLAARKEMGRPWHRPPHPCQGEGTFHLSAACFEHAPVIGHGPARMAECEEALLAILEPHAREIFAWCILPNHYHVLIDTPAIEAALHAVGQFHGRSSHQWNGEDNTRGRKVWYRCSDRGVRTERHFWAALNYVHHNPVRHGYVRQWQDWPYSSAKTYLEAVGRDEARRIWIEYPLLDYGDNWDI